MTRSLVAAAALIAVAGTAFADGNTTVQAAMPPAQAAQASARPLKLEVVDQVIETHDRAVQSCRRHESADTIAVLLRLDIDGSGKVLEAAPTDARANGKLTAEEHCLVRLARKLQFPPTGTISHLDYPFMLEPRR